MSLAASPIETSHHSNAVTTVEHRSAFLPPAIVIITFAVLCAALAYYLNIWQDEAYSLHSSSGSIAYALHQGLGFEAQAPLYFVALAAWRELNASAPFARLLSIIFSIVTLLACWSFARSYLPKVRPVFLVAAVAFNPFTVWAAVEIRPYAAALTFSAVLLLLVFRGFFDDKPSLAARLAYLVLAVAGAYTQYYVAFLIPAHFVALAVARKKQAAAHFLAYALAFGLALLPLARFLPSQFESYHAFAVVYNIPSYIMATVLFGYPFPHEWIGTWIHRPVENVAYLLLTLVPIGLALGCIDRLGTATRALLAMIVTLFSIYVAAIGIAHVHVIIPRHTLVMLVPMLAGCFALIGDVSIQRRSVVLGSYAAIYSVFAFCSLWNDFHSMTKIGDWHRVANFVSQEAQPADGIALFNAEAELPFRYYFKKHVPVAAIPRSMTFERFDEADFVLHSPLEVGQTFGRFAANHKRVWLIETDACTPQYAYFGCRYLNTYVAEHFNNVHTERFDGTTVIELERRLQRPQTQ